MSKCKHDWVEQEDGTFFCANFKEGGCNETRTVDELWRKDMPKSENPLSRIWFIYNYWRAEGWSDPTVRTIQGMERYGLSMDRYRFWHGPGCIMEPEPPPPVPESKISP